MPSHPQALMALVRLDTPVIAVGGARSPEDIAQLAVQLPATPRPDAWLVACEGLDVFLVVSLGELPGTDDLASLHREGQRRVLQAILLAGARSAIVLVRTRPHEPATTAQVLDVMREDVGALARRVNCMLRDVVWVRGEEICSAALGRALRPQAAVGGLWSAGIVSPERSDIPSYAALLDALT
ncbi:MAG: hypothetical protein H3C62_13030 [Gemmatimonadaceae bacterium]|nr:hypothetical protein [Gemmatimonadaceae bacterium]